MRILLTATASYAPPRGGATRSNLVWLNQLASAGHECRIVSGPSGEGAPLAAHESVRLASVADPARRVQTLRTEVEEFRPDWVLVSSEDAGHSLLREADHSARGRVVYLAHTPQFFPFGSESWNRDPHNAECVRRCAGVVTIGPRMRAYVERELGMPAAVIHPPIYGSGPFPNLANSGRGRIAMLNPCAVKGVSIFLAAAARLRELEFGATPGWATSAADIRVLGAHENVTLLKNAASIDDVLGGARVLMMPSLWLEGFGLIVVEAMLRGIPVVASQFGGLEDAKLGTGYAIPVSGIETYLPEFDEHGMPRAVLPDNDAAPWIAALRELCGNRAAYERESEASRRAAERFVNAIDPSAFENFLASLGGTARAAGTPRADGRSMESLTPAQRELLLRRARERGAAR